MLLSTKLNPTSLVWMTAILVLFGNVTPRVIAAGDPAPAQPLVRTNARIDKIDANELTLQLMRGHSGVLQTVKLNDKTIVILPGGKEGKSADLKPDQWVKLTFTEDPATHAWLDVIRIEPSLAPWDQAKFIETANAEAQKAYRKKHGLAADAPAPDFDRDRKPTGAVHDDRVEPAGDNWRVILISSLTVNGVKHVVSHVEVTLDKAGKLVGDVKFVEHETDL